MSMHPNIAPTTEMGIVCEAAAKAAKRNSDWESAPRGSMRGVRRASHRKITQFNVTFGGGTFRFYLNTQGYLYEARLDEYVPIKLAEHTPSQLLQLSNALNTIAI